MTRRSSVWLILALVCPVAALAGLGWWALRSEADRAMAAARAEAEAWLVPATRELSETMGIRPGGGVTLPLWQFRGESPPPSPLVAKFEEARAILSQGKAAEALPLITALLGENTYGVYTPSGVPLQILLSHAQRELPRDPVGQRSAPQTWRQTIHLYPDDDTVPGTRSPARHVCDSVHFPSPLTSRLVEDEIHDFPQSDKDYYRARARRVEAALVAAQARREKWTALEPWQEWRGEWWHANFSDPQEVRLTPLELLREASANILAPALGLLPRPFAVKLAWQGKLVLDAEGEPLAEKRDGAVRMEVVASPEGLREIVRRRTRSLAWMFGGALLVAATSSLATWRAFRKQAALAELQTDFVASVSHELRTPVASIGVLAERLESGKVTEPAQARQYHEFIAREGRRLAALIDNVLDFSRIERGRKRYDFEPSDLPRLARETVSLLRPVAEEKGLTLREEIADLPEEKSLEVDAVALRQALVNLLDNAIKFTPAGGAVTIGLAETAEGVCLWVADTGIGIPRGEQAKIFDRFHRVDNGLTRETTGAGIGLSLVKHIVEAHDGQVEVESTPGQGARFGITLPTQGKRKSG